MNPPVFPPIKKSCKKLFISINFNPKPPRLYTYMDNSKTTNNYCLTLHAGHPPMRMT